MIGFLLNVKVTNSECYSTGAGSSAFQVEAILSDRSLWWEIAISFAFDKL